MSRKFIYAFKKIFGSSSNEKGNLIIKVSKYNNWFDIYLQVGDREYRIVNTKIHVFKQGIHEDDEKAVEFTTIIVIFIQKTFHLLESNGGNIK